MVLEVDASLEKILRQMCASLEWSGKYITSAGAQLGVCRWVQVCSSPLGIWTKTWYPHRHIEIMMFKECGPTRVVP